MELLASLFSDPVGIISAITLIVVFAIPAVIYRYISKEMRQPK